MVMQGQIEDWKEEEREGRSRGEKGKRGENKGKKEKTKRKERKEIKILSSLEDLMTIDATVINTNQTETSLGNKRKVFRIQALTGDMGIRDVRDLSIPKLVRGIFL